MKFSLDLRAADPTYAYTIGSPSPDDIVIVDDLTVEMTVPAPNNEIVTLGLAAANENLYPADFGGRTAEEYFLDPIGAGPFVLESNSDSGITFVKNNLYWDAENITLDAVELVIAPDPNAKLVGFESGDFDIITRQSTGVVDQLDAAGTALVVDPSASVEAVFLNGAVAPFDDVNFRRAVWYGIDRTTIADGVFDGLAKPAQGMIPSALSGATPGANPPVYDPELAAEFLAASAYADDASFDLVLIDGDGARRDEAQVIADQLDKIGITANVTPLGYAEWADLVLVTQGHQANLYGYETVVTPASDIIGFFATTAGFFGGYDTTNAFGQFAALQAAPDVAGQSAVIEEFETEFGEMAYAVPVVEPLWVLGVADGVTGLVVPPTGFPDVAYVSLAG
ncbi:MAG: ABC transporter substrate-binding protein [Ilumatobacteraceae bacterium]